MQPPAGHEAPTWEQLRAYLTLLTRLNLDARLQGKVDLSGVVQQTLLDAHQEGDKFRTLSEAARAGWLMRALANNLNDEIAKFRAGKRNVEREQSLEAALEASSARLGQWLAVEESSPSQKAMHQEELYRLAQALDQMPQDQRRVVELIDFQGSKLAEAAQVLERSKEAVMKLHERALKKLRQLLGEPGRE
jgi:RNA polymerase sigma-70 factor (ECF subfamily)